MGDLINLDDVRKSKANKYNRDDEDFEKLYAQLDSLIEKIDVQYNVDFGSNHSFPEHSFQDVEIDPVLSSLYNSYYALLAEDRNDLADLLLEIIKMT